MGQAIAIALIEEDGNYSGLPSHWLPQIAMNVIKAVSMSVTCLVRRAGSKLGGTCVLVLIKMHPPLQLPHLQQAGAAPLRLCAHQRPHQRPAARLPRKP